MFELHTVQKELFDKAGDVFELQRKKSCATRMRYGDTRTAPPFF